MKTLFLCSEAGRLDAEVQSEYCLPGIILMEDAAVHIWEKLSPMLVQKGWLSPASASDPLAAAVRRPAGHPVSASGPRIVALAGKGNNGGDALAVMRQAAFALGSCDGLCCILAAAPVEGSAPSVYINSLRAIGVRLCEWGDSPECAQRKTALDALRAADIIIDGLSGTGLKAALHGSPAEIVSALGEGRCCSAAGLAGAADMEPDCGRSPLVCSIDLPSGLSDSLVPGAPLVHADFTFSIEPRKLCLYAPAARPAAGEIVAVEGVFPRKQPDSLCGPVQTELLEEADLDRLLPRPSPDAHKGGRGRVGIYAGSPGMAGAARFAAGAAAAASAGIVYLCADSEIAGSLSGTAAVIREAGAPCDYTACLAGPGWGRREDRAGQLLKIIESGVPLVVDADGLRVLAALPEIPDMGGRAVLTPHPGEFAALSGCDAGNFMSSPLELLRLEAARRNAFIILKSQCTWICSPEGRAAVWDGRDPSLATAGSGDVLAGLCVGLLAAYTACGADQGEALWNAARASVIAHGLAGRRAFQQLGWYQAQDIIPQAALILAGKETCHVQ